MKTLLTLTIATLLGASLLVACGRGEDREDEACSGGAGACGGKDASGGTGGEGGTGGAAGSTGGEGGTGGAAGSTGGESGTGGAAGGTGGESGTGGAAGGTGGAAGGTGGAAGGTGGAAGAGGAAGGAGGAAGGATGGSGGGTANACTKYVSPSGSLDGHQAFTTIQAAIDTLTADDTLCVGTGTYVERVSVGKTGTETNPIRIFAFPGHSPVIDGQNWLPNGSWAALVELTGAYIHMSGFEVRNTNNNDNRCVNISGPHNTVSHMNVHHCWQNGILAGGDYSIVEYSRVWQTCRSNSVVHSSSGWASGLSAARGGTWPPTFTKNAVLRGNTVYNNWGEGLSTYEADGTIIEDNVVYDNWAVNTYISDASNVVFQRNIVYSTPNNPMEGRRMGGLTMADEVSGKPRSTNNVVVNNMLESLSAFSWTLVPGHGLDNVLIAHNTLTGKIRTGPVNHNTRVLNNITLETPDVPSKTGLTFSNNLWPSTPPANASGPGDTIGSPHLLLAGGTGPGELSADYFKLTSASILAIGKAQPGVVPADFFLTPRGAQPDIGAHEFQ